MVIDNSVHPGYNAFNQKRKPFEGREVETGFRFRELRIAGSAVRQGFEMDFLRALSTGVSALLERDGTQTRYQAAPYVGTG